MVSNWRKLWMRLLNTPISVKRGYLALTIFVILLAGGWFINVRLTERRLLEAIHQQPDSFEEYSTLYSFYGNQVWIRSRGRTFQRLSTQYPDHLLPLVAHFRHSVYMHRIYNTPVDLQSGIQALQKDSHSTQGYITLAYDFIEVNEPGLAAQAAEKALMLEPDNIDAHYVLGQALKYDGNLEGAREQFLACTNITASDSDASIDCAAELIRGTRELTLTLQADRMNMQTRAVLDIDPEQFREMLQENSPSWMAQRLAWGGTEIKSSTSYLPRYSSASLHMESDEQQAVVASQESPLLYRYLWRSSYSIDTALPLTIEALPLTAYTNPTTVTVIVEDTQVVTTTHSYANIMDETLIWQMDQTDAPGEPLGISVAISDLVQRTRLMLTTNLTANQLTAVILHASSTLLTLPLFIVIRRQVVSASTQSENYNWLTYLHRMFHPHSLFSWIFDLAVLVIGILTILYPLYMFIFEGIVWHNRATYYAYLVLLGLLPIRLVVSDWRQQLIHNHVILHVGAILFICYLLPRFTYTLLIPFYLVVNGLIYYLLLMRNWKWSNQITSDILDRWFPAHRHNLIEQIDELDRIQTIENARRDQLVALARGKIQTDQYEQTQDILNRNHQQRHEESQRLRAHLYVPENESPRRMLFRLGPSRTMFGNSIIALLTGLIPYVLFLVLSSYQDQLLFSSIHDFLYTTVGMPWGPIYLFFFGYFYRAIWGDFGVIKGLIFGVVLLTLGWLYHWMWYFDQVGGIELWGTTMRILVTFVFVGFIMDWITVGFAWRQVIRSYDSPAMTTILAVTGTAFTTIITGIITGTLSQLLNFAFQLASESLGLPPTGPQ